MPRDAAKERPLERQHKALLIVASVVIKTVLMVIVATHVMCGSADPRALFACGENAAYVGGSAAAVALMGFIFGHYIVRLKSFDAIFGRMMGADFMVTVMYFAVAFIAPDLVAEKTMIWLFGTWILGMLLAPVNSQKTFLKKLSQYGGTAALGAFFSLHFIPEFAQLGSAYTAGMMVSSILAVFGGGRTS
ncbi:MAG: hypothetical protein QXJ74_00800 [Nitrososphaera sp.]|uniref:hypothetical protein n=1 Tax=Nitrososphaera sp. TaxID=1971748 RepID=UPI00185E63A0|nr:hypothetical protein [Nitrososphaera sp.]NWG37482.1 hypothetical protein [Nitrososphaera sp.]